MAARMDAYGYRLLLLVLIIGLNAFFAGAEVALLSVRRSKLRSLADEGNVGAQAALSLLANPERLLSVVQVGVTLASLGLGWVGEDSVFRLINSAIAPFGNQHTEAALHALSFTLSFLVMTYAHVVIGEVVPKNLAIEKADRLAIIVAPALLVFYRISGPFVLGIERSAAFVSRLMKLKGEQHGGGHSAEELKFIISSSGQEGHLLDFEQRAMQRLLDLQNFAVREIMVPRNDVVSAPVTATLDDVLDLLAEHQYSRLPVYEDKPENIIGILHNKDLVGVWAERRKSREQRRPRQWDLRRLLRKAMVVPETKALNQLIDDFRTQRTHMAVVVDEFGTIVGLVTLEDVMEQIFGEIEDEHDIKQPLPAGEGAEMVLEGGVSIRDLETQHGIEVPANSGFETLAGFMLFKLGRIPAVGDSVEHGGVRFSVVDMDRNRISRVLVDKLPPPEVQAEGAVSSVRDS